jgi:hypothetical protein
MTTTMKYVLLTSTLVLLLISAVSGQQSAPPGMRYQAIARDIDGNIRASQPLEVKAELVVLESGEEVVYEELHHATSGEFGLLNITIGEGSNAKGQFSAVPWTKPVWVRISIKHADDQSFQLVTTSKLYSVPYAFYAETAGSLKGSDETNEEDDQEGGRGFTLDQTAPYWTLDGNKNAHAVKPYGPAVLGTTDRKDLTLITNNIPRLIIDKDGHISILGTFTLSGDLNVTGNTTLNGSLDVTGMNPTRLSGTLDVDKAVTLNDSLTVANSAPTLLTGPLDVEQTLLVRGATTIKNTLDVIGMMATHLSGTLTVDKSTTLNSSLTVANMAPTHLTGLLDVDKTLTVDGATTLNNTLTVTGMNATTLSGSLTVDKASTLNNALTVANAAPTHLTGALTVDGNINVGGDITLDGPLLVEGMNPAHLTGTLDVDKLATLNAGLVVNGEGTLGPNGEHVAYFNNTEGGTSDGIAIRINNNNTNAQNNFVTFYKGDNSIAGRIEGYVLSDIGSPPIPTNDEIWAAVCITVADYNPVTIFWTQFANNFNLFGTVWNGATIPAFAIPDFPGLALPDFPGQTLPDYPGMNLPDFPGQSLPDFPGVTLPDIPSVSIDGVGTIFPGLAFPDVPSFTVPDVPGFEIPNIPPFGIPDVPAFAIPDIPAFAIPDVPEIDLSADLFTIPTVPTFSDILIDLEVCPDVDLFSTNGGYVYRLIQWGVQNDMQNMISFNPIDLVAKALTWGVTKAVKSGGVTYGSQGADYAEYLPKLHATEQFMGGEIVGVHGGRISKVTTGADQVLAISTKPLVLGNQPDEAEQENFEKVGFLGQVPVFVQGPVELGDYIIPSGKNDGIGIAIGKDKLTAEILPLIFGKAWSSSPLETTVVINTSIGLRPIEIAEVLQQRDANLKLLQTQMNEQDATYRKLKDDVEALKVHLHIGGASASNAKK